MTCPRCRRALVSRRGTCAHCGYQPTSTGGSSAHRLDRATDAGPLGPLQDFVLREPQPAPARNRSRGGNRSALALGAEVDAEQLPLREGAPPGVDHPLRTITWRLAAGLMDGLILVGINLCIVYFTLRLANLPVADAGQLPSLPLLAFLFLFDLAYLVVLTALGGQTIGKMAAGLRVEHQNGRPVSFTGSVARTAAYLVSVLPAGLGFVGLFSRRRCTLHDLLAQTRVVRSS